MLTTEDRHGQLRSRPMVVIEEMPEDCLWFFSDASSQKIDDIHGHHDVNVCYADPAANKYVSVTGRARLVRDRAKMRSLWRSSLNNWFSKEPDDPEIVLLKVEVMEAELWQSAAEELQVELIVNSGPKSTHEVLTNR